MGWGQRKGESVRIDSALLNKIRVIAKTQGWTIRTTLDRAVEKFIGLQPKPKSKSKG